ncbi:putative indole-3-pyruvate monooxygenase YUCCA10 [Morella rubra]|uniref:Flavin-containing monooxygenase n=1 Tax=Morella rubra TaxID=262757 RepID=A0A6A1VH71_9ROSI|nr:putative indole-3-pyruvate monooxygenase YUCCA10 [Morella rubra]
MEVYIAEFLVVASGENSQGFIPTLPGLDTFLGKIVHANEYKSGSSYQDKEVLVVDCGNSSMKISYDLSNFGAHTDYQFIVKSDRMPRNDYPNHWKGQCGVYCAGLSHRGLLGIFDDARAIANDISKVIQDRKKEALPMLHNV